MYIISKTSTTLPPPKNAWGRRGDKHTKKLLSNSYAGTLPCKMFIASQGHWKWSENIFPRRSVKREVCSESITKFSSIQFFLRNATISGSRNFGSTVQQVEKKLLETAEYWSIKKHMISHWAELLSKNCCWEPRSHTKHKGRLIRLKEFPQWIFLFHFSAQVLYTR